LQVLKRRVSRTIRRKRRTFAKQLSFSFDNDICKARRCWQRRFYDFKKLF
jgi:hypothetical protein